MLILCFFFYILFLLYFTLPLNTLQALLARDVTKTRKWTSKDGTWYIAGQVASNGWPADLAVRD